MSEKYNVVGKVIKPHGIKGEAKVDSYSRYTEERFKVGNTLFYKDKESYKELKILVKRGTNEKLIIGFEGFTNPESLYPILGKTLYGKKDKSILKEGDNFYSSYKGSKVFQFNEEKGVVKDIVTLPQCDYLVINTLNNEEKLIPLLDEFVDYLDDEENVLYLKDYEGLL